MPIMHMHMHDMHAADTDTHTTLSTPSNTHTQITHTHTHTHTHTFTAQVSKVPNTISPTGDHLTVGDDTFPHTCEERCATAEGKLSTVGC